jgi:hypothetical protein
MAMKAFNGGKFLEEKSASITFSNGKTAVVCEIKDETMTLMDTLGKDERTGALPIREVVASMCGFTVEDLASIGLVELKGALDFLSESLFSSK